MARPTQFDRRVRRLLLPYGVGLVVLVVLPALLSFVLAFFRYDGLSPPRFAGTLNFRLAFTDDLFTLSIANSLALVILPVPAIFSAAPGCPEGNCGVSCQSRPESDETDLRAGLGVSGKSPGGGNGRSHGREASVGVGDICAAAVLR